jgi:hypothetical protein
MEIEEDVNLGAIISQDLEAPFSWLNGYSNELRQLTQILKSTFLPIKRAV